MSNQIRHTNRPRGAALLALVFALPLFTLGCVSDVEGEEGDAAAIGPTEDAPDIDETEAQHDDDLMMSDGESPADEDGRVTYATTYDIYYSKSDVRRMYRIIHRIDDVCHYLPLPYLGSIACTASPALKNAVDQAYYQNKRIKAVYYSCGFNYCSYYKYYVVP